MALTWPCSIMVGVASRRISYLACCSCWAHRYSSLLLERFWVLKSQMLHCCSPQGHTDRTGFLGLDVSEPYPVLTAGAGCPKWELYTWQKLELRKMEEGRWRKGPRARGQTLVRKTEEKLTVHTLKVLSGIFDNRRINHHTTQWAMGTSTPHTPQSVMACLPGVVGDGSPFNGFSLP